MGRVIRSNQQQCTIVVQMSQRGQITIERVSAPLMLALVIALVVPVLAGSSPCSASMTQSEFASPVEIGHCALLHHGGPTDTSTHCHGSCWIYAVVALAVTRIGTLFLAYRVGSIATHVIGRFSVPPVPPPRLLASTFESRLS